MALLTLEQIITYCGKAMYERGIEYINTDALYMCYRDWMTLKALCEGKAKKAYAVQVTLDNQRIFDSSCTCYKNHSGPCKHIAAILLTWLTNPELFPERAQLTKNLETYAKQDLVSLIEKMVDSYPETVQNNRSDLFVALG